MTDLFSYINESDPDEENKIPVQKQEETVHTVHEITMKIKGVIEPEFNDIWVEGEI